MSLGRGALLTTECCDYQRDHYREVLESPYVGEVILVDGWLEATYSDDC